MKLLQPHRRSDREVFREIEDRDDTLKNWALQNPDLFVVPNAEKALFVAEIYKVAHFQQNIEQQKLYNGGKNADPFVIARAGILRIPVVTSEKFKPNAARIPNICRHFQIDCMNLEEFMEHQNWHF